MRYPATKTAQARVRADAGRYARTAQQAQAWGIDFSRKRSNEAILAGPNDGTLIGVWIPCRVFISAQEIEAYREMEKKR